MVGVPGAVECRGMGVESRRLGEEVPRVSSVAEDVLVAVAVVVVEAVAPLSRAAPAVHRRGKPDPDLDPVLESDEAGVAVVDLAAIRENGGGGGSGGGMAG